MSNPRSQNDIRSHNYNQLDKIIDELKPYIKKENDVYSSRNDQMIYYKFNLKNKLQIFLIDDSGSNISSALMYVSVGSNDNPKDLEGLAHYLEHMLFMGSDLYPGGTYFQNSVSKHGGMTNAFTTDESTQYYFTVSDNFMDILKVFSRFFIKPSFDVEWVEKEVNAVDSEHNKNIGSDSWRLMHVAKNFYTDEINNRFTTGTKRSLIGAVNDDANLLRDRLIKFYESHYSSDRMLLFISHKLEASTIQQLNDMFEDVPLRKTTILDRIAKVKDTHRKFETIIVKTVNETNCISIGWLLNGSYDYVNGACNDSYDILSYIFENTGEGGLYDMLKKLTGVVINVSAGVDKNFANSCFYEINIRLTFDGISIWKNILYMTIIYIKQLYKIAYEDNNLFDGFYNEMKNIAQLQLQIMNKQNTLTLCQYYADVYERRRMNISYAPIAFALFGSKKICRIHFNKCLKHMKLENAKVLVYSPTFNEKELPNLDPFYGTRYNYRTYKINSKRLDEINKLVYEYIYPKSSNNIRIPQLNPYISSIHNMMIIDPIVKNDESYRRIMSKYNNLYYLKKGNTYKTYSIYAEISIELDALMDYNPNVFVMIFLYGIYINKIREKEKHLLQNAKIWVDLIMTSNGIVINISGYNNNFEIDNIFKMVIKWYYSTNDIDSDTYNMVYNDLMNSLQNYQYSDAYSMIGQEFRVMINKTHSISNAQMIDALSKIKTIEHGQFRKNVISYISNGKIIGVFNGSITVKQVSSIISSLEENIKGSLILTKGLYYDIDKKDLSSKLTIKNKNPNNYERALGYGIYLGNMREIGENWEIEKSICILLESFLSERFSAVIRTEKQIGYIAICHLINVNEQYNPDMFLVFIVQSTRTDLYDIVNDYIENILPSNINDISEKEFMDMKSGLITSLSEKSINSKMDCHVMFMALSTTYDKNRLIGATDDDYANYRYNKKKHMVQKLNQLTRSDFINFILSKIKNSARAIINIEPNT